MDNATSLISQFALTETQIKKFADKVADEVESGQYNPLQVELNLKAMEKAIKEVRNRIEVDISLEAGKYDEKVINLGGARIEKKQRTSYDFSRDTKWQELKKKIKDREQMLRNLSQPVADPETGEMIQPAMFTVTPYRAIYLEK